MKKRGVWSCVLLLGAWMIFYPPVSVHAGIRVVKDALGRRIEVPETVERVICSGAGSLRLLTYLESQDRAVAVDDMERRRRKFDARPYALANPQFKRLPIFGEFRGHDHPELILSLHPLPQVIFKTHSNTGYDPAALSRKTGIPVVLLNYGNLANNSEDLYRSLRLMGKVLEKAQRAEEVIDFFRSGINDLQNRTKDVAEDKRPRCFVGGVAYRGPHGYQSTEPGYPPFAFIHAHNLADDPRLGLKMLQQSSIAKEKIVAWDPEVLFLDLSTLQMGSKAGGWFELKTDPAYQSLSALKKGRIYGVLPYNWYTQNSGSILANAYFIGKLLYPEKFTDIEPKVKADEIYTFLIGEPVFEKMNTAFSNLAFRQIPMN